MREDDVTRGVIEKLEKDKWTVLSSDFSGGTGGRRLQSSNRPPGSKHKGSITPDIIAHRGDRLLIVECGGTEKGYSSKDEEKLRRVKSGEFDNSINRQLESLGFNPINRNDQIKCAIGLPADEAPSETVVADHIDAIFSASSDGSTKEIKFN